MIALRLRWQKQGVHIHVRVFAGPTNAYGATTLGKCGDLCFREDEWQAIVAGLKTDPGSNLMLQVRPEDEHDVRVMAPLSTT